MNLNDFIFSAFSYINHQRKCRGARWLHAPFFFQLYSSLNNKAAFSPVLKKHLVRLGGLKGNTTPLNYQDVGAGSRADAVTRTVGSLARHSLSPTREIQKILILTQSVQPDYFVELGTCLGETALCLHQAFPHLPIVTLEGAPPVAAFARNQFSKEGAEKIDLREGLFVDTLSTVLDEYRQKGRGMFLIDGHHAFQPTLDYADAIFEKAEKGSVLLFDDIHWSPGMLRAWKKIQNHPKTVASITWFRSGWVFTDPQLTPRHYRWRG